MKPLKRDCDHAVSLSDGRTLGYAEYGSPTGFPVIYFHGGLSCRIDATSCGPAAASAGIRVIAPDRPGVGLSDRHKGASLLDWPTDVEQLADHLGFTSFAVAGWSFGGAYAAACGFALANRVTSTALIASGIPRDWPNMAEQIDSMDRIFLRLSGRLGLLDEVSFVAIREMAQHMPRKFVEESVSSFSEQSRAAVLRDPDEFVNATIQAFVHPGGALDDYRIWNEPWGFDVADIAGPVRIWHGEDDELCPPDWSKRLADAIPSAHLNMVPGAGHFVARDHWEEVLSSIARA